MLTPSRTPIDHPYVDVAVKAARAGYGAEPILFPNIGGAAPDYLFVSRLQVPCIVIPYAAADQNNHAPNESQSIDGFFGGIRSSAALIHFLSEKGKV